MCGIAGAVAPAGFADPEAVGERLGEMVATIAHRGPDDQGVWHDGHAGLGAARLAIIDLSAAGHQPMGAGPVHIAYNGEVYNFAELRRELAAAGHPFRSRTDTEVILRGYRQWGSGVIPRLRGMFALAIWDAAHRRLLLARDRLGQKPLYYLEHDGILLFGSEIKAVLAWPGVPRVPHLAAIDDFLTFRYVPGPQTAFAGVRRLPAAHTLTLDQERGGPALHRYWEPPPPDPAVRAGPGLEAEIRERFDEAVRLRLVADVPLGAFLSGGIDSSSVVAAMAAASDGPVRTFTVGFEDRGLDERAQARAVADRYGTLHTEIDASADPEGLLPRLAWHYGEPYADPVAIPTYLLAAAARRHVKVVLTGDGGDETFLGYRRHAAMRAAAWIDAVPAPLRAGLATAARRAGGGGHLARFAAALDRPPGERYAGWVGYMGTDLKSELYDGLLARRRARHAADVVGAWFTSGDRPEIQAAAADLGTFLPDDLLVRLDVATMAHGLEARSPFLDHHLVELALSIPAGARLPRLRTKGLLRRVMAPRLPADLARRPKLGFPMPLGLRRPGPAALVRELLSPAAVARRGLFRPEAVTALVDRHLSGRADHEDEVWELVVLEAWFRMWIDPSEPPPPP